jgi:hypothetical protein
VGTDRKSRRIIYIRRMLWRSSRRDLRCACFRLLALPRHRRSRQVQCQPQGVPPECIVSFLHTPYPLPGALLNLTRLRGMALMQVKRPLPDARRVLAERGHPPAGYASAQAQGGSSLLFRPALCIMGLRSCLRMPPTRPRRLDAMSACSAFLSG